MSTEALLPWILRSTTASTLSIRYEREGLLIEYVFNAANANIHAAIKPLMAIIKDELARAQKGPSGTLDVTVAAEPKDDAARRWGFRVKLRNSGIGGIALTDPRVPRASDRGRWIAAGPRLEVRVGEVLYANIPPNAWTILPLEPLPADASPSLVLAAGRGLVLDFDWVAPRPGHYEIEVKWEDYDGPIEPVPGQTPFMPLPERGPSFLGSGPYPIRGANFATLRIEVPKAKPAKAR